jgi:hypothetical protein
VLALLQGQPSPSFGFAVAGGNERTGILNRKDLLVLRGAFDRFAAVGRQERFARNTFVLEETLGGFGFRPIGACLVDRAFRSGGEPVASFDQPRIEPGLTETDLGEFRRRPTGLLFAAHSTLLVWR